MTAAYRASFGPNGIELSRHGKRAYLRFPDAKLNWTAEGTAVAPIHFLGRASFSASPVLRASNAYPGVDIVLRMQNGRLKSEFQVAAGVSPAAATYCVDGATVQAASGGRSLRFDAGGDWHWTEESLESWQTAANGARLPVESRFSVKDRCVAFSLGAVDPALPLTIDPDLVFNTYLGGGLFDAITAVHTDGQGNIYLAGWTESSDLPAFGGYQYLPNGRIDGFVAKANSSGILQFCSYFGGELEDRIQAMAVDGSGAIVLAGFTNSSGFPTQSALRGTLAGGRDAFVSRLNAAGSQLIFSTYLGGSGPDSALALTVDASGNIAVVGETASTDFPRQGTGNTGPAGGVDGFLARFSSAGTLLASTYFGGSGDDRIRGVAIGADGTLHLTGSTASVDLPVLNALFPSRAGSMDAFYVRYNSAASGRLLSTYLGGSGGSSLSEEAGYGIAIDSLGRAWVAGVTPSTDFPGVSSGHQSTYGGGNSDAFISVFSVSGALEWSTYLGGSGIDAATAISAGAGFVGLAGYTTSLNLPVTGALQATRAGEYDAFWAAFPIISNAPLYISYLGGTGSDSGLAASANGSVLAIGGMTLSTNLSLISPIQWSNPGSYGGFAARVRFGPGPIAVSPNTVNGPSQALTFTISHANGSAAIQNAGFIVNSSFSTAGGCYIYYNRGANLVSLFRDQGSAWLNVTPGSGTVVDNGVCTLSGTGLTLSTTANTLTITLPLTFNLSFAGPRQIYANANDAAGIGAGWPQVGTWQVGPVAAAPEPVSITPSSGSATSQLFTTTVSDANGQAGIATVELLVNNSSATANGCYVRYSRAANVVSLFRDSDSIWLPLTPGAGGSVSNDACTVSASAIAVSTAGNSLTVSFPIEFRSAFTGAKSLYLRAADTGGLVSAWQAMGTWTLASPAAPAVTSVTPTGGASTTQAFTIVLTDTNGHSDLASALFLINGNLNGNNGCFLTYDRAANSIYLFRDADSSWLSLTPGASATVANANCTIAGTGLTITPSGNTLTIALPITASSGFTGLKNVYVAANDIGGLSSGWITGATWNPGQSLPPSVVSLSPSSGGGLSQIFTLTVSDPNGAANITSGIFVVNPALTGANSCYMSFNPAANALYLFDDASNTWQTVVAGSSTTVTNSRCSLSGTGMTISANGNSLVITLPMSFAPGYTGVHNFYAYLADASGLNSGWASPGTWTVSPPAPPSIPPASPASASGLSQTFTVTLSDPNGAADITSAIFLINPAISGNNSCYMSYNRAANSLYLFRDADNLWQPISPGSATSVSNANCALSGTGLTITASGTNIVLTLPLTLAPAYTGAHKLYAYATDAGGLNSGWVTAAIWSTLPAAPAIASTAPATWNTLAQTFTFTLSDANGAADISGALFVVNPSVNGSNSCYMSYNRAANAVYLFHDASNTWQPLTPGTAATVSNPNCTLSGTGLSIAASGNTITLVLPLTLSPGYTGAHKFHAYVVDNGGLNSGWVIGSTFNTAPPSPPVISSFTPASGSGSAAAFTATITDANGHADITAVLFLMNSGINGNNGCFISYNRAVNLFYLLRDADGVWQPLAPGAATTVTNNNCTLSGTGLTVTGAGNNLTVTFPLSFKALFAGPRNVYLALGESGGGAGAFTPVASWNVTPP